MTTWQNDPKRGVATWTAGQEGINAGSEFDSIYNLEVLAGLLGIVTDWTNQVKETINI